MRAVPNLWVIVEQIFHKCYDLSSMSSMIKMLSENLDNNETFVFKIASEIESNQVKSCAETRSQLIN